MLLRRRRRRAAKKNNHTHTNNIVAIHKDNNAKVAGWRPEAPRRCPAAEPRPRGRGITLN